MKTALQLLAGVISCAVLIALARRAGRRRELQIYAWSLAAAALVYVAFAAAGGARGWLWFELAGLALFAAFAVAGLKLSPLLLALGWAAHAAWDVLLHRSAGADFVPDWYPWACLGFDLMLAAYVAARAGARRAPTGLA